MSDSRETILARLRTQQSVNGDGMPPVWRSRRQFDDLEARFADSLKKVYGEPFHAESLEAALIRLNDLLRELNARCIVANHEPPLSEIQFQDRWPELDWHMVGQTSGDLRSFCASADVGLSSADAVLAETGSLVVTSGPGKSRLATLLPPVHIALVPISRLTTDIFTFIAARQGQLPANMVFISGPSKTGDIEQTMSIGVHGPKRFIVILYQE
jgi:L-lactate utilization protein LutC